MDVKILYLPTDVNEWDVTRTIAAILHSDDFALKRKGPNRVERDINFKVKLTPSKAGGVRNDGSGVLTMPSTDAGYKFLDWVRENPIKINGKKVKFYKNERPPLSSLAVTLDKTPYINPDLEEEHAQKLWDLQELLRVDAVQVGQLYRPAYPSNDKEKLLPRAFSIEWEKHYTTESIGWLAFEYDHKLIRIKLGNQMTEKTGSSIAITFASIQKIGVGYDGKPYICFDTVTPPVLEEIEFHRALTGDDRTDNTKFKRRIGSLHPGHEVVAPYARHLRIVLYNDSNVDMINKFITMCETAGLAAGGMILRCEGTQQIDAHKRGFFTTKRLHQLRNIFKGLPWPVAFQLESLLHNHLLHTDDIHDLLSPVRVLCEKHTDTWVGDLLRRFNESLQARSPRESPMKCFGRVRASFESSQKPLRSFRSCHVTFTPTRMILEGPYPTQSNRVIRQYEGYENHFIRVDFRDEDRLQYRWDRAVDGATFVRDRVGGILKNGFELAGRRFEFLAYSSSALREHAVWFMSPFNHSKMGFVTSNSIRNSLGDFQKIGLLSWPSKYAARLAQAFTATDSSVTINRDQWEEVPDLGVAPYEFTDGVGTISRALGDRIWSALCETRTDHGMNSVQPSAYQIRFLGYKGVVGVDKLLDEQPGGILMRLRKSMNKFPVSQELEETADIEIAQAFGNPNKSYLNRPLVMLLEDLGVRTEAFIDLQNDAVAEAGTVDDSSERFRSLLNSHGLGNPYRLSQILGKLEDLGLELNSQNGKLGFDTPFFKHLRHVSKFDVLRDIKFNARIPIPDSYLLVGVSDEGPAYEAYGYENIYTLPEGHIFACIQKSPSEEPVFLSGSCSISRSPVAHPGDVQRVRAIGKPPEGILCLFAHMKNVVVLPSVGSRSLASHLGGGDLDGDLFSVILHAPLLPSNSEEAAKYPDAEPVDIGRDSTVEDICDFVVEYINSDVLGLLSDRLLVIADQSVDGMLDENCIWLAELCSQAVDYPKRGVPVDIDGDRLPRPLIRCKPDWHAAEVVSPRPTDYYESNRALGEMYRSITLNDPKGVREVRDANRQLLTDPISQSLIGLLQRHFDPYSSDGRSTEVAVLYRRYLDELRYICTTHTLTNEPGIRLMEEEVVAGTILAKCSQKRWRKDRIYRMRLHASNLVRDIREDLVNDFQNATREQLIVGLERSWQAWHFSLRRELEDNCRPPVFGSSSFGPPSFGLIALCLIFDCLDRV